MLARLSQTMGELIGFRALQGIGAGGLMVSAQAVTLQAAEACRHLAEHDPQCRDMTRI